MVTSPRAMLAIICSGTGFTSQVTEFLEKQRRDGYEDYDLVAIPGGIHVLASSSRQLQHARRAFEDQISFLVSRHDSTRVVVMDHEECRWFNRFSSADKNLFGRSQRGVLTEALGFLTALLPKQTQLEVWYGLQRMVR